MDDADALEKQIAAEERALAGQLDPKRIAALTRAAHAADDDDGGLRAVDDPEKTGDPDLDDDEALLKELESDGDDEALKELEDGNDGGDGGGDDDEPKPKAKAKPAPAPVAAAAKPKPAPAAAIPAPVAAAATAKKPVTPAPAPAAKPAATPATAGASKPAPVATLTPVATAAPAVASPASTQTVSMVLSRRLFEMKQKAVKARADGNMQLAEDLVLGIRRLKTALSRAQTDEAAGIVKPIELYDIQPPPKGAAPPASGAPKSSPAATGSALKKQKTEPAMPAAAAATAAGGKSQHKTANASTSHLMGKPKPGQPVMAAKPVSAMPSIESLPEPGAGDALTVRQGLEYDMLIAKLKKQVDDLADDINAVYERAGGKEKADPNSKLLALQYFRHKKLSADSYDLLIAARAKKLPPPTYRMEDVVITREVKQTDLTAEQLELSIVSGKGLNNADATSSPNSLCTYVGYSFDVPAGQPQKGTSNSNVINNNANPAYNFIVPLKLGARTKGLAARFKLLRIIVQVFHKRSWPRSDLMIGEGEFKIAGCLEKCVVESVVKLKAGDHRTGELLCKARVRTPLLGADVQQITRSLVVLDQFFEHPKSATAAAAAVAAPATAAAVAPAAVVEPTPAPAPVATPTAAATTAAPMDAATRAALEKRRDELLARQKARQAAAAAAAAAAATSPAATPTDTPATPSTPAVDAAPTAVASPPAVQLEVVAEPKAPAPAAVKPPAATATPPAAAAAGAAKPEAAPAVAFKGNARGGGVLGAIATSATPELLANPDSLYHVISNDVLEYELKMADAGLRAAKPKPGEDASAFEERKDELADRKLTAQTQLNILVAMVQAEKLSLPDYLKRLEQAIARDKAVAVALGKLAAAPAPAPSAAGDEPDENTTPAARKRQAGACLQRIKIMAAELKNAQENM